MSYKQHHFSELEEEYYNYQLKMRKALSKEYSPIIEQQHKTFAGELKKIHDDGFVEVENNSPEYKEAFKKLQATVLSRYENNTSRTLSEPLAIEGWFELVKEHLVPFAQSHFECVPVISFAKVVKSYHKLQASDTQFFHRDPGSYKILKCVLYLTDVDENSGPFVYIKNSHKQKLHGISGRLRMRDEDITKPEMTSVITGPAGHMVFFDAMGIHKGQAPIDNDRIALIINFCIHAEYGQKDDYPRISFDFTKGYTEHDLLLLDACVPVF